MNNLFPWYDSTWLSSYVYAKHLVQTKYPHKYPDFIDTFRPLRTLPDFNAVQINRIFDDKILKQIKDLIKQLKQEELEKHEFFKFGRFILHDHPYFNHLQQTVVPLISDRVGEAIEPSYNFLCLYNNLGTCGIHMDAPLAKWTLDICIEQSHPWPIYFSQVQPWPEHFSYRKDWEKFIKHDSDNLFTAHTLNEGEAVVFSGSSQWHYRDRIPKQRENNFCHLIFFHFIPTGMKQIIKPKNWAKLFDIPELALAPHNE